MLCKHKVDKLLCTQTILLGQLPQLLQNLQIQPRRLRPIRCLRIIGLAHKVCRRGAKLVRENCKLSGIDRVTSVFNACDKRPVFADRPAQKRYGNTLLLCQLIYAVDDVFLWQFFQVNTALFIHIAIIHQS